MTEEVKTEETVQAQVEPSQIGLSIQDLAVIANIINLASQRGAFKANEMSAIGAAYDKLNAFVSAAQQATAGIGETEEGKTE